MVALDRGLYELIVTKAMAQALQELEVQNKHPNLAELGQAEAADRISLHLAKVIRQVIDDFADQERVQKGSELSMRVLENLGAEGIEDDQLFQPTKILSSVSKQMPDGSYEKIEVPLTPLLDTTLLTNAPGEPVLARQLESEIDSADRIDLIMAFIRKSGLRPMLENFRRHCAAGKQLRVLTTTYTGSTEQAALDQLKQLGAEVRVSYDLGTTRLHAKSWLFYRATGFSTAYVGSSNLTFSAQVTGLEWNVRLSGARNGEAVSKLAAVFEALWSGKDFVDYDSDEFQRRMESQRSPDRPFLLSPIELRAEPFQQRMLDQLTLSRQKGFHRNLLASATGTGKTVMAALDYRKLKHDLPRARLLFVAHRSEILEQSLATYRQCLGDSNFGELWEGGQRPKQFEAVFASIQSLNATGYESLAPDHFDVVVVDEFHHAAAATYKNLLEHVKPVELLGMTATPERSDGLSLLHWFDNRIAAELRLWDAIEQQRLCPFVYYGIHDGLDLSAVPWRRGRGYDVTELLNVFTTSDVWVKNVCRQVVEKVDDPRKMKALGFCVSIEHAKYMATKFNSYGIPAVYVSGETDDVERAAALRDLKGGVVNIVFSVDLFNEGVDLPAVDTLLFLRPTDSPTLFLQQLGRGLRRSESKAFCTVLDFVGQHRSEFRMDRRFRALLGGTRKELETQVEAGFPYLPAGCQMHLDRKASELVLKNIRESIPRTWAAKSAELQGYAKDRRDFGLAGFLDETGYELDDVYGGNRSWSDLMESAGLPVLASGPNEEALRRACGRLLHIEDGERLDAYRTFLQPGTTYASIATSERQIRLLRMLVGTVVGTSVRAGTSLESGFDSLVAHKQVVAEILELLAVLQGAEGHLSSPLAIDSPVPLHIHGRYTRQEIMAAYGLGEGARANQWITGVQWAAEAKTDLLAFTLDKSTGHFSPTTRYRDFAVSPTLVHWESQSVTRANSETGKRYQNHAVLGSSVMLFARLNASENAFWFLGPATYVKHESEKPMGITWRLTYPIPADLYGSFAAAVA